MLSREFRYELKRAVRRLRGPFVQVGLATVLMVGAITLFLSSPGRRLENSLLRLFFSVRGAIASPDSVTLVAIDDASFVAVGGSPRDPMPRRYVAEALRVVREAQPRLVMIDANIPPERLIDPQADANLESVLQGGPFAIWSGEVPRRQDLELDIVPIRSDERFRKAARMEIPLTLFPEGSEVVYVADSALPDSAPIDERVWMARPFREIAGIEIEPPGRFDLINFYGPPGSVRRISMHTLLNPEGAAEALNQLREKVVIFGYQSVHYGRSTLSKDELFVPVAVHGMFGAEIHATVAANLLDRSWLRRLSILDEMLIVTCVVFLLASITVRAPRPLTLVVITIAYSVALIGAYLSFSRYHFWIGGLPSIGIALLVMMVVSSAYFLTRSESYRRYIERTFSFNREEEL